MQERNALIKKQSNGVGIRNLTSLAFEKIHSDIIFGRLRPNERLRIQNLSERYDVGATAIREALSRLLTDGLVISQDQRGFSVSPVSRDEILDLTQTRAEIESLALAKAIAAADVSWESLVLGAYHRLSRCAPPTSGQPEQLRVWSNIHREFHEALIAGCQSPWLIRLCALLYDKTERYRNLSGKSSEEQTRDIQAEHQRLTEAAIKRDSELACRLIADHFQETTNIILSIEFEEFGVEKS